MEDDQKKSKNQKMEEDTKNKKWNTIKKSKWKLTHLKKLFWYVCAGFRQNIYPRLEM